MQIKLHANARLTPKQRGEVQASFETVRELSRRFGVTETTIRRWRNRVHSHNPIGDRSHTRHQLHQSTTPVEEELIVALRVDARLSLDDILEVMHRCVNKKLSRSAVYRCLKRFGVTNIPQENNEAPPKHGTFEDASCGFIHVDLKHLTRLEGKPSYVFVAIDRATRFVHIDIISDRAAKTVATCLSRFLQKFPHKVHTILTDNGSEFTDRFAVDMKGKPDGKPSGGHLFDRVCIDNNIEHRLIKPFTPQTNGMVERFNRRISQAIRNLPPSPHNGGKNKFKTTAQRTSFLHLFVDNYNKTRLRCLNYTAPIHLLHNHTKYNTQAG